MGGSDNIRDLIKAMVKNDVPLPTIPCKVISVDDETVTCDVEPLNGDAEVFGVLLSANEDAETGVILFPKVGSTVYIIWLNRENALVSLVSEVDKVSIKTNNLSLVIDDQTISLNGDVFGGIVDAKELKTQVDKNSDAISKILNAINNATPIPQDGGAGLQSTMKGFIVGAQTADLSNIENLSVTHGN